MLQDSYPEFVTTWISNLETVHRHVYMLYFKLSKYKKICYVQTMVSFIYNIIFPGTNPSITELQPLARDRPSTQCGISFRQTNIYR